jgi:hypothetical protein
MFHALEKNNSGTRVPALPGPRTPTEAGMASSFRYRAGGYVGQSDIVANVEGISAL